MILYKKIKELRLLKGLTQIQVAEKINMPQSNYTKVENGKLNLKIDKVHILAELFGVPAEELLSFENTNQNTTTQTQENNNNEILKENENLKKEVSELATQNLEILEKYIETEKEFIRVSKEKLNFESAFLNQKHLSEFLNIILEQQVVTLKKHFNFIKNFINNLEDENAQKAFLAKGIFLFFETIEKLVNDFENDFEKKIRELKEKNVFREIKTFKN